MDGEQRNPYTAGPALDTYREICECIPERNTKNNIEEIQRNTYKPFDVV